MNIEPVKFLKNMLNTDFIKFFFRFDKIWLGFALAAIVPAITLFIVYLHSFDNYSVKQFFHFMISMRIMSKLFSLCVLPNLGLFFLFIWGDFLRGARGVLMATFVVTIFILVLQQVL
jgi:uncharacterized membrane protein